MPAFYLLIFIGAIILWFSFAFLFLPMGRYMKKFFGDAIDIIKKDDDKENIEK